MQKICILLVIFASSFWAALSASADTRAVRAGSEAEKWAGVGILQVQGGGFCSAALIDAKTVLTAAHCVYSDRTRALYPPQAFRFLAGWRDGITAARRGVVRVVAHRDYDPNRAYDEKNIAADIAIVELDAPVEPDAAASFARLDKVRVGRDLSVVSFSGRRSDVASIDPGCKVKTRVKNSLELDCISSGGMSGAPIFAFENGRPKIVALVSGTRTWTGTKRRRMIALAVERPLRQVLLDARDTRSTPRSVLPHWSARAPVTGPSKPIATRKVVSVSKRKLPVVNRINSVSGGRKVVKPPKRAD